MFIRPFGMQKLESKCLSCLSLIMNRIDNASVVVEVEVVLDFYLRQYQGFAYCFYVHVEVAEVHVLSNCTYYTCLYNCIILELISCLEKLVQ